MPIDPDALAPEALASLTEQLMLEQQRLEPLELLLAAGVLGYLDYEAWRMGRRDELQSALRLSVADTVALLERAAEQARHAGMLVRDAEHRRWGDSDTDAPQAPLSIGADPALRRALGTHYAPAPRDRQLDLFYDSGSVAVEQSLRDAVAERRLADAQAACAQLLARSPARQDLGDWLRLIAALDTTDSAAGAPASRTAAAARLREIDEIAPLASKLLGYRARDALAPLWDELVRLVAGIGFDAQAPRLHASWVLARLGRWDEARAAIEAEPHWRAEPLLLERHAAACSRAGDRAGAVADWLRLCWAHPEDAERLLGAKGFPDTGLAARWSAFCDLDPPQPPAPALETEDFPAWCVLRDPTLASIAPADPDAADPDRADAYRAALALASAPDDLSSRRALGEAHPTLLADFLVLHRRR